MAYIIKSKVNQLYICMCRSVFWFDYVNYSILIVFSDYAEYIESFFWMWIFYALLWILLQSYKVIWVYSIFNVYVLILLCIVHGNYLLKFTSLMYIYLQMQYLSINMLNVLGESICRKKIPMFADAYTNWQ